MKVVYVVYCTTQENIGVLVCMFINVEVSLIHSLYAALRITSNHREPFTNVN